MVEGAPEQSMQLLWEQAINDENWEAAARYAGRLANQGQPDAHPVNQFKTYIGGENPDAGGWYDF